jgi:hypothetical protein
MTVSPIWTVWCDGEQLNVNEPTTSGGTLRDVLNHRCHRWCAATGDTLPEARRNARTAGWKRPLVDDTHRDLCPPCHNRYQATQPDRGNDPT